jgi:O-antigen/teichoic acid export membrane protein
MKRGEVAHSVTRGAFYLSIEKVAALFSGVVYFALVLRWMGPTKYGIITLALSFAGLAATATGNFEVFLERFAAEYHARDELPTLRRAHVLALLLKLGLGTVAGAAVAAAAPFLARQFDIPELATLLPILSLIVAFDGLATTGRATLYGLQQFRELTGIAVVVHVVKTAMVGLLWWYRQDIVALAIGLTALTVVQGLLTAGVPLWILRAHRAGVPGAAEPPGRARLLRSMVAYCAPLLGARLTFVSGQNLGKIVLGKLFDPHLLGYFSFAFQTVERFVEVVYTLPSALLPSLTHLVARGERDRLENIFDQALRLIQVAACALSIGLFTFAREVTLLVGSPLFAPAVPLLQILALVPIARTSQQPITMLLQAMRLPGTVLRLALVKFAAEFGCYFLLLPPFQMAGAALANLAGATLSYVAALSMLARVMPDGARERARSAGLSLAVTVPLLGLAFLLSSWPGGALGFVLRLLLVPAGMLAVFAIGLVNGYDVHKLSSLPLKASGQRWARDRAVAVAGRLVQAFEPRRAP